MTPALVKARELRIAADRRAKELEDKERNDAAEAAARRKLVVDAINEAFGGARTTYGRLAAAPMSNGNITVVISAGGRVRHHVDIETKPSTGGPRYRIVGRGDRVYDSIPEMINGLAEVLAPELDLTEPDERPVHLTDAERAAVREILTVFHPAKERHPDVDVAALLKKLED